MLWRADTDYDAGYAEPRLTARAPMNADGRVGRVEAGVAAEEGLHAAGNDPRDATVPKPFPQSLQVAAAAMAGATAGGVHLRVLRFRAFCVAVPSVVLLST